MGFFFIYIIKSTCCLILFYLGYTIFLSHETFFRFNRKILLTGMVICLFLPVIKIQTTSPGVLQQSFIYMEELFTGEEVLQEDAALSVAGKETEHKNNTLYSPVHWYLLLYYIGVFVSFCLFCFSFRSLYLLRGYGKKIKKEGYTLILLHKQIAPFNWWKYIFISTKDYELFPEEILEHEAAHCRRLHSLDLVFMEMLILLHWFNPVVWALKRELQDVHEYEADSEVLKSGIDATRYQLLLVKKAVGSSSYTFANGFNQSKLKKRIKMMCKKQSNRWNRWKVVLLLPVAAGTLYAFARPEVKQQLQQFEVQFTPDEEVPVSSQEEKFTDEYFQVRFKEWAKKTGMDIVSFSEKDFYADRDDFQRTIILVNAIDQILYNGEFESLETLPKRLSDDMKLYNQRLKTDVPIIICFQTDKGTSPEAEKSILRIVGETFEKNQQKGRELLLFRANPKNYGVAMDIRKAKLLNE